MAGYAEKHDSDDRVHVEKGLEDKTFHCPKGLPGGHDFTQRVGVQITKAFCPTHRTTLATVIK